ncbi:MAG TPA: TIGR02281 family clan AA aspartic protease [Chromatiales bacterium]|nr:TIGR02281 family clan AA aspartic protease [Chromatiales bacterium]HEX22935.1 TIGR02281 family clan AA aspartic protease [Chromatiales bacterium]
MPAENSQRRLGVGMTIAMWIVLLGLLTLFFQDWDEKQRNPNQNLQTRIGADGVRELVLTRNRAGHYVASGSINGEPVVFMLDTGATDVAIPGPVAKRLRLKQGKAMIYRTANGPVKVYATVLDDVSLDNISLQGVRASINPAMRQQEVLLGMSFLKHLEFTQRGNTLTLRQY